MNGTNLHRQPRNRRASTLQESTPFDPTFYLSATQLQPELYATRSPPEAVAA
jgi:hypothetical protein